ncbi:dienelactone hydrolase family protein [Desulfovibrio sp. TomC]|uniref:dienelactone hydrolase family protein n=1 Tax=Desulfovibrio sp. TomC TaxID=1562888 RepID=UPI0005730D1D|nr:dienelactone hydrolase family protein [Desulfovibrio sp. TomC]KHK03158.1 putative dienelactone hydrolase [Desulfovibrio sp. TomC]
MNRLAAFLSLVLLCPILLPRPAWAADVAARAVTIPTPEHPVEAQLFSAPGTGKRPAVILLHGRQGLDRFPGYYEQFARAVAGAGMDAYLLSYYDGTEKEQANAEDKTVRQAFFAGRVKAWSQLVHAVVTEALARKECSGSIGLLGFSQGGFLATAVAGQDPRITALAVFYGGIPGLYRDSITHLPPLLALHGDADTVVPLSEGQALVALGRKLGQPAELAVFPGAGHGFSKGPDAAKAQQLTLAFLRQYLLPARQ